MSTTSSSSDELGAAASNAISAIEKELYPLWTDEDKRHYEDDVKPQVKFAKSTVIFSQHSLYRACSRRATVARVSVVQVIWGRRVMEKFPWLKTFLDENQDFEKFPHGPLVSLPRHPKSPAKRKAAEPLTEPPHPGPPFPLAVSTEMEADSDTTLQENQQAECIQSIEEKHKNQLKGFKKSLEAKFRLECSGLEAKYQMLLAMEKAKFERQVEENRTVLESRRKEDEKKYAAYCTEKDRECEAVCAEERAKREEDRVIAETQFTELVRLKDIENEERRSTDLAKFQETCLAKDNEHAGLCEKKDREHQQHCENIETMCSDLQAKCAELQARCDELQANNDEFQANIAAGNQGFSERGKSESRGSTPGAVHNCAAFCAKKDRECKAYCDRNRRNFQERFERLERTFQDHINKKEREFDELCERKRNEYEELSEMKDREVEEIRRGLSL